MKATKLGIWMDYEHAYLTEFTVNPMKTITIESASTHAVREESLKFGERHKNIKEQHQRAEYYKKLAEKISAYKEVILFGPTHAKRELCNYLRSDHVFDQITIHVEQADKMTQNQLHDYVRKYFTHPHFLDVER